MVEALHRGCDRHRRPAPRGEELMRDYGDDVPAHPGWRMGVPSPLSRRRISAEGDNVLGALLHDDVAGPQDRVDERR
jgi:hypothetical protein